MYCVCVVFFVVFWDSEDIGTPKTLFQGSEETVWLFNPLEVMVRILCKFKIIHLHFIIAVQSRLLSIEAASGGKTSLGENGK